MRQHYTPEPRRSSQRVRGVLLAIAIGVSMAYVLTTF
jgi:hypothetical protein